MANDKKQYTEPSRKGGATPPRLGFSNGKWTVPDSYNPDLFYTGSRDDDKGHHQNTFSLTMHYPAHLGGILASIADSDKFPELYSPPAIWRAAVVKFAYECLVPLLNDPLVSKRLDAYTQLIEIEQERARRDSERRLTRELAQDVVNATTAWDKEDAILKVRRALRHVEDHEAVQRLQQLLESNT